MKIKPTILILLLFAIYPLLSFSQTPLFSNYRNSKFGNLRYFAAVSEPNPAWYTRNYDDTVWPIDSAIIGYGYPYGNTGYSIIDSTAKSLYVRFSFTVENKEAIKKLDFAADFDDGFIAYLNGVEIARVNVDVSVQFPLFDAVATRSHQAEFGKKGTEITRPNGIYLDSTILANCLVNGENVMAVHIVNDNIGDDLMFAAHVIDITNIPYQAYNYIDFSSRCKKLIDIDSTDLPLFVIETDQNGITYDQRNWAIAHMGLINNTKGNYNKPTDPFNEYNGLISIRTRGQSSRDFAKKSYRFELVDEELKDTSFALLGMPKESDWILFGPFSDKSQIRNKFAYDLASRMGNYAPRTRFCELIMNGQSEGTYILSEQAKRDKNRINISKLDETDIAGDDVSGGYIFKFDKVDIFPKGSTFAKGREIVYPDIPAIEQQNYLTKFFSKYDSILLKTNIFQDPAKGFRKYASDSSLIDFIIINELAKNPDAYIFSTVMYKDRDDKDGRMKFGPIWDCDIAFGNSQFQEGFLTSGWQFNFNSHNRGMFITRYFQDTLFVKSFQKRWHQLRAKTFSNDSIFNFFDELVDQVQLAQVRNYEIWPTIDKNIFYQAYRVSSYENELETLKIWLTARLEWLDNNVDKIYYPLKVVDNNQLASISERMNTRVYPNPFDSELAVNFYLEKQSNVRIELYNMTGQFQHQINIGNVLGNVDFIWNDSKLSTLKSGMYVAKVYVDGTPTQSLKIIKR